MTSSLYPDKQKSKMTSGSFDKLAALKNPALHAFISDAIDLCEPESVVVFDDSKQGFDTIRRQVVEAGEETPLAIKGHTLHFDGPEDQGRDREVVPLNLNHRNIGFGIRPDDFGVKFPFIRQGDFHFVSFGNHMAIG